MTQTQSQPQLPSSIDRPMDNTAIAAFNRCPELYNLSMRQHRRSSKTPSPALAAGKLWHTLLEWHYRTNGDIDTVIREAEKAGIEHDVPDDYRSWERLVAVEYPKYVNRWGMPQKEGALQTLGFPQEPVIEITSTIADDELRYPYTIKVDRGLVSGKEYFVEDHKTTSRWSQDFFQQFKNSNQMKGYCYGLGKLLGVRIAGARINVAVIRKNDSQFEREIIRYNPWELEEWVHNYNRTVDDIQRAYETDSFRMAMTDGGCSGKYGLCHYFKVCTMRPDLRQQILERDFEVNPWNPLETEEYADI